MLKAAGVQSRSSVSCSILDQPCFSNRGQTSGAWVLMWVPQDMAIFGDGEKTKMDRKRKAFITSLKTYNRCRAVKANTWKKCSISLGGLIRNLALIYTSWR